MQKHDLILLQCSIDNEVHILSPSKLLDISINAFPLSISFGGFQYIS